ncbi:MAG: M48 family metallopeptidase [Planctomycetes bacterium]|nr:M48 family metallopeptidase [Planctomycetota bacterium]
MSRLAVPCAVALTLTLTAGCRTAQRAAAGVVLPVSQENELGREMERELARDLRLLDDPEVVGYVRELGRQIVQAADGDVPEGIEFEFHVVDDDATINAFAIPGGGIYVYTGLLRAMEDEAQLTAVLGHEVAHVTRRHIAQQLTAQFGFQALTAMLGSAGGLAGLVGQLGGAVASQGFLLKYSRDNEREADYVGLGYQARAGWDPRGMMEFFTILQHMDEGRGRPPAFLLTHPAPDERVINAHRRIAELQPTPTRRNRERYQQMLSRLRAPTK